MNNLRVSVKIEDGNSQIAVSLIEEPRSGKILFSIKKRLGVKKSEKVAASASLASSPPPSA